MIVAAEPKHAEPLSLEILRPLDLRARDDAVRQNILVGADENKILNPLKIGAHDADAAGETDFRVSADECCGSGSRRLNIDQIEVKIIFLKYARLAGDPRKRLRNRGGGMKANELVRGQTVWRRHHEHEHDDAKKFFESHYDRNVTA